MAIIRDIFLVCFAFTFVGTALASTCPTGYTTLDTEKHIDTTHATFPESTFIKPESGICKIGGYSLLEIPDDIVPIFNGFTLGSAVTLCTDGYLVNNGSCTSYSQGSCETDFVNLALDSAEFIAESDGLCKFGGYTLLNMPYDDLYPVYNGFTAGSEVVLCNNGFRVNNSSCTTYDTGECPENYQDLALNENTMAKLSDGVCATGYQRFAINQQCDANTTDAICAILCTDGLNYTDVGTCAQMCQAEYTTLRTSTGLVYPMYSTKQITPSINLGIGNTVCYVNLVPGGEQDAIHIKYNNQTYHAVQ